MLALATTVALGVVHLNTQLDLRRNWVLQRHDASADYRSPSKLAASLAALNYRPLAADLLWIALITDHAHNISQRGRASEQLLPNGRILSEVDPFFYRPYDWVPGAFLSRRHPITAEDLADVAAYADRAIAVYPSDLALHVSAALNFVGYGSGFSEETYRAHSARAVAYLEDAAKIAPDDVQVLAMLEFFRKRERKYGGEADHAAERNLWLDVLRHARDEDTRKRAVARLKSLGVGLDEGHVVEGRLLESYERDAAYMPFELYLLIGAADARD